jgi:DNA polymerase IV
MGRSADVPRTASRADGDDTGCSILHVDMDAFYASVEILRRPDLRGRPVIVGGGARGVVSAASYEARRYGVRSAMPIGQAMRRCPAAIVLPPDHARYAAVSSQVMTILRGITPLVEPLSLDEAFLDVSGAERRLGRPAAIAAQIRADIRDQLALTCSVGVAPTKFVAKVASARCKPDGLLVVPTASVLQFLHPLPVTVLWGVGARTAEPLRRLGVRTIGDLAETPLGVLRRAVGDAGAEHLHALAWGRDPRPVQARDPEKSISVDHTTSVDLTREADVLRELLHLAGEVGERVRRRRLVARTVGIKIRFADFRTVTRVRTLPGWVDSTAAVYDAAAELYRGLGLDQPRIRLVGVKCENLRPAADAPEQLMLDTGAESPDEVGRPDLDRAADLAKTRFGRETIKPATLLGQAPARRGQMSVSDHNSE